MKGRAAGTIALITKVIVAGVTVATLGALMFAVTMEDNDSGMPYVNRVLRPKRSPGPVVKPAARECGLRRVTVTTVAWIASWRWGGGVAHVWRARRRLPCVQAHPRHLLLPRLLPPLPSPPTPSPRS